MICAGSVPARLDRTALSAARSSAESSKSRARRGRAACRKAPVFDRGRPGCPFSNEGGRRQTARDGYRPEQHPRRTRKGHRRTARIHRRTARVHRRDEGSPSHAFARCYGDYLGGHRDRRGGHRVPGITVCRGELFAFRLVRHRSSARAEDCAATSRCAPPVNDIPFGEVFGHAVRSCRFVPYFLKPP